MQGHEAQGHAQALELLVQVAQVEQTQVTQAVGRQVHATSDVVRTDLVARTPRQPRHRPDRRLSHHPRRTGDLHLAEQTQSHQQPQAHHWG